MTMRVLMLFLSQFINSQCILRELSNLEFSPTGETSGIAVSDLDNDGTLEVIVSVMDGPNKILKYDHATKTYFDVARMHPKYSNVLDEEARTRSVSTCDMNGDGVEEIYLLNDNEVYPSRRDAKRQPDKLLKFSNGHYTDMFSVDERARSLAPRYGGHTTGCIDRTGGGMYDIVVATYKKDGKGTYKVFSTGHTDKTSNRSELDEISEDIGLGMERDGRGIVVGSIFSDSPYCDIFITNVNSYHIGSSVIRHDGRNALFKNRGDGKFEDVAVKLGVEDLNYNGRGSGIGDLNADGITDIMLTNWLGPTRALTQKVVNSTVYFRAVGGTSFTHPSAANVLLTGDFDNDGNVEVLKAGANGDELYPTYNEIFKILVTQNSTDSEFWRTTLDTDTKFKNLKVRGIATADLNGDGLIELFISHENYHNHTFSIFQNNIHHSGWIRIIPLTKHGSFARGSTVILKNGSRERKRVIIGGDCSYMCQSEPVAHFGLGNSIAMEVEIVWPDGHTFKKVLYDHDNRKTLVISYTGNVSYMTFRFHQENDITSAGDAVTFCSWNFILVSVTTCLTINKLNFNNRLDQL